jgi:N6-adenosine-specific RNA methylase IME4
MSGERGRIVRADGTHLAVYDEACRIAEAVRVDEILHIHDEARALAACARVAKNRDAEADAVVLRMRAARRLDRLVKAQKDTVGLATGGEHGGRARIDGSRKNPSNARPTLASQGIDKNLANQARVLGGLSDEEFEAVITDARDKVKRAVCNAVREVEIRQERETYAARIEQGCTVADLKALAASGYRASVIYVDVPSRFEVYSSKGKQRSADRHYDTKTADQIKAMGLLIRSLTAKNWVLFYWTSGPYNAEAIDIIRTWKFDYSGWAFTWFKTKPSVGEVAAEDLSPADLHWGTGYTTRANAEIVLLGKRGEPRRLTEDMHSVIIAPAMAHSEKPEEVACRIERLYPGPYLELFARKPRDGWTCWGNEIQRDAMAERAKGATS